MRAKLIFPCITILILLLAGFLRLYDSNWDSGFHLHPDERFLTMVGTALKTPHPLQNYFNQSTSTLNPANIGFPFFVYGTFPLTINWLIGLITNSNTYDAFYLQGRILSAICDTLVLVFLYKIIQILEKRENIARSTKLWAIFIYAIAVLPIQLSHFFAVDTFLQLFLIAGIYAALAYRIKRKLLWLLLCGCLFGLALGSKISAVYFLPLILILFLPFKKAHLIELAETVKPIKAKIFFRRSMRNFTLLIVLLGIFGLSAYLVLRVADPYVFQYPSIFDPRPSQLYLSNLSQLKGLADKEAWFPPNVQWIHKTPVIFAAKNILLWGFGIPASLFAFCGLILIFLKKRSGFLFLMMLWGVLYFFYQSFQTAQTMRYFLPLYPLLAIAAAVAIDALIKRFPTPLLRVTIFVVLLIPLLLFFSIYTRPHTRVSASDWIVENVPAQSVLLSEHWDDALPLPTSGAASMGYELLQLPVFDPDTDQKWQQMDSLLGKGDYLVLSSNRGWGSIPTAPERYPRMTKFYTDLFAGKGEYRLVKEFTSYPSLTYLGIPFSVSDDNAEEAFTVYDHPKVMIFKKQ